MTNAEAIQYIDGLRCEEDFPYTDIIAYFVKEWNEALEMAIEALSREQKKYDAICGELVELKSNLNLPIEVAMAYEKSISIVRKYTKMGDLK